MKLETQTEQMISETAVVSGQSKYIGIHALAETVNSLWASGAVCVGEHCCRLMYISPEPM